MRTLVFNERGAVMDLQARSIPATPLQEGLRDALGNEALIVLGKMVSCHDHIAG